MSAGTGSLRWALAQHGLALARFLRQRVSPAPICAGQGRFGRRAGGGAAGRATVLPELATIPPQSVPT